MRENNQNKNTQRSTKNSVKVFDLWRAERSEVRKLEEIPKHEFDDVLWMILAVLRIFLIELFPNWTACSPITYTNSCGSRKIHCQTGEL